jgi:single-strand DNA-binding protein
MAVVSGRLQMRSWEDRDGKKRVSAEVVADNVYFGDSKREEGSSYSPPPKAAVTDFSEIGPDDDLPFDC